MFNKTSVVAKPEWTASSFFPPRVKQRPRTTCLWQEPFKLNLIWRYDRNHLQYIWTSLFSKRKVINPMTNPPCFDGQIHHVLMSPFIEKPRRCLHCPSCLNQATYLEFDCRPHGPLASLLLHSSPTTPGGAGNRKFVRCCDANSPKKDRWFFGNVVVSFCVGGGWGEWHVYTIGYVTSPLFTHRIAGTVSTVWGERRTFKEEHPEKLIKHVPLERIEISTSRRLIQVTCISWGRHCSTPHPELMDALCPSHIPPGLDLHVFHLLIHLFFSFK